MTREFRRHERAGIGSSDGTTRAIRIPNVMIPDDQIATFLTHVSS